MKDNNNWGIKNKLEEFNLINEPKQTVSTEDQLERFD